MVGVLLLKGVGELDDERGQPPLVLERQRRRGRDGLDQQRVLLERAVVEERRDRAAVALDHRGEFLPARLRELDRVPLDIGEGLGLGNPVGES